MVFLRVGESQAMIICNDQPEPTIVYSHNGRTVFPPLPEDWNLCAVRLAVLVIRDLVVQYLADPSVMDQIKSELLKIEAQIGP
jgi:hypothetical protein